MGGPLRSKDATATGPPGAPTGPDPGGPDPGGPEVVDGRALELAGFAVRRALPRRGRRTIGAWCFADHLGPGEAGPGGGGRTSGLDVGPHPHVGLQTVTWLVAGAVLHRDGLGTEQLIRPGELNVMTAGTGVAHSEETTGVFEGTLHGAQLWVAQPSATRDGPPAFEHHGELPRLELGAGTATVLVGALGAAVSPARRDSDHVGADLDLVAGRSVLEVPAAYEHGFVVLEGRVRVLGAALEPGRLAYLAPGRDEIPLEADGPARVLLLGGVPFPEELLMWWNYVARTRAEIAAAHRAWTEGGDRFGPVASALPRIDVPPPPWAH